MCVCLVCVCVCVCACVCVCVCVCVCAQCVLSVRLVSVFNLCLFGLKLCLVYAFYSLSAGLSVFGIMFLHYECCGGKIFNFVPGKGP